MIWIMIMEWLPDEILDWFDRIYLHEDEAVDSCLYCDTIVDNRWQW